MRLGRYACEAVAEGVADADAALGDPELLAEEAQCGPDGRVGVVLVDFEDQKAGETVLEGKEERRLAVHSTIGEAAPAPDEAVAVQVEVHLLDDLGARTGAGAEVVEDVGEAGALGVADPAEEGGVSLGECGRVAGDGADSAESLDDAVHLDCGSEEDGEPLEALQTNVGWSESQTSLAGQEGGDGDGFELAGRGASEQGLVWFWGG
jgi:hypothetical protein